MGWRAWVFSLAQLLASVGLYFTTRAARAVPRRRGSIMVRLLRVGVDSEGDLECRAYSLGDFA